MALVLQGMIQIREAQVLLSQAQLLTRIQAIDLSDGVDESRQIRLGALRCGQCGRENLGNRQRCLHFGNGGSAADRD